MCQFLKLCVVSLAWLALQTQATQAGPEAPLLAVVGVFSGAGDVYLARRNLLRSTWFPASASELRLLRMSSGIDLRFVLGNAAGRRLGLQLDHEEKRHGAFFRVNVTEAYSSLPAKVWHFMRLALRGPEFRYILKVDDDVYLRPRALMPAMAGWGEADYVACFRRRGKIRQDPQRKFFEHGIALLGRSYFTYATGSTYALSHSAASLVTGMPLSSLRILGCGDDCSVGLWLLAFNATFLEDRSLCQWNCTSSQAVSIRHHGRCGGLCNPARDIPRLHADERCQSQPGTTHGAGLSLGAMPLRRLPATDVLPAAESL